MACTFNCARKGRRRDVKTVMTPLKTKQMNTRTAVLRAGWTTLIVTATLLPNLTMANGLGNRPAVPADETSKISKDYSRFFTGFQHLPKRADSNGTPIHISGRSVDEFRVTEHGGNIVVVKASSMGEDATKFRIREEEECADQQAAEVKSISNHPKYRALVNAGVFSAVDIDVQFATYTSERIRIPTDGEIREDLVNHVESRWAKPSYEVYNLEKYGVQIESGKIVLRPFFTSFTMRNSLDRPGIPMRRSTEKKEYTFMCTVIPNSEILVLMDRIRLGAKQMLATSRRLPEPLRLIPAEVPEVTQQAAPQQAAPAERKPTARKVLTIQ
jgi:hypothetical protein